MYKQWFKKNDGYTLTELLVASAIFTTFLAVAVGSFTRVLQVQRILSRRIVVTSALSSTIEMIAREVRLGYKFDGGGQSISFESFSTHAIDPIQVSYSVAGNAVTRNGDGGARQITPTDVEVQSGQFIISQKDKCDPWRITIVLLANPVGHNRPEDRVNVQTTVTSRVLPMDIKGDPYQCKKI